MAKTSTKSLFSKSLLLGTGADKILLNDSEVLSILHISLLDLEWDYNEFKLPALTNDKPAEYYEIPLDWFQSQTAPPISEQIELFETIINHDADFGLYFHNLCSLHKRRIKYQRILSTQPRPTMEQIGPRSLLEYGLNDKKLLANWMIWRKWIFDIDNRSGQETGYLFEPILASCLGGVPMSSSKSPVSRIDDKGQPTKGSRQVDCYVADENIAYEFKLRVTIAASGQGRFAEELSFPAECKAAGIKPIILVLDSTPSDRLKDLEKAFLDADGESFIGEDAWAHMEKKSGKVISTFLEKYIKAPLLNIANQEEEELSNIYLTWDNEQITVSDGEVTYEVKRK
jgi:hypothetical protein